MAVGRALVDAFLAASRTGNFEALFTLLDPDVVYGADLKGRSQVVRGATAVVRQARAFLRLARFARVAPVNGAVGIVVAPRRRLRYVARISIAGGKIARINVMADPAVLRRLHLTSRPCLNPPFCWPGVPISKHLAGTTTICGLSIGEQARSSSSISIATAESQATGQPTRAVHRLAARWSPPGHLR